MDKRLYPSDSVMQISGVGAQKASRLAKLGIQTVRDLLYFFPRAYEKRGDVRKLSQAEENIPCAFVLTVGTRVTTANIRRGYSISKFRAFDESGSVEIMFFNSPFVKDVFHTGTDFRFYGKLSFFKGKPMLSNPKYEAIVEGIPLKDYIPVYHLTEGITSAAVAKLVEQCVASALPYLKDPLPESVRLSKGLPTIAYAVKEAHFPTSDASLSSALRRLAFDEMLLFALRISTARHERRAMRAATIPPCLVTPFTKLLPYELTQSQKCAVNEIYRDMTKINEAGFTPAMARILVGDVGSGKTVCAALSAYVCIRGGFQVALMAPTEILARQHFAELSSYFSKLDIKTELLIGATSTAEKKRIYQSAKNGEANIVIGTHALLSDKLEFQKLGLVITDEQHRFGVLQRAALKEKNEAAHLLVMSATPIPRTLALSLYGDLDVSRLTELPSGRKPVDTFVVDDTYEPRLLAFIEKQINEGGQCYVVCPSIEQSEEDDFYTPGSLRPNAEGLERDVLCGAVEYADYLSKKLPSLRVACLHGKMKAAEKDAIMTDFSEGKTDILVSTTVIEVGINVPRSNLMIIKNAERFGLSQLHQLRGRVGRGTRKSYCILVSNHKGEAAKARLSILKKTNDGYTIAEQDLIQRGPGDFFPKSEEENIRQSGGMHFRFAKLCDDTVLFNSAFSVAKEIIEKDPMLSSEENAGLLGLLQNETDSYASSLS